MPFGANHFCLRYCGSDEALAVITYVDAKWGWQYRDKRYVRSCLVIFGGTAWSLAAK